MAEGAIEIRPATPGERDAVLDAYEWLFAPPGVTPPGWSREAAGRRLDDTLAAEDAVLLAAFEGRGLVGICSAYLDLRSVRFGERCWVEDLAVDPGRRSRGIGGRLLAAAREWGRGRGATHLELDSGEARRDAHRFYERERPAWRSLQYTWLLDESEPR
jgi:GNAT superfamily N-acetyltransferase